ncbi:hybrid sensor histidine kinase/response regulator [Rufibacter immobilis]|uniref:hybrid sensor histidine kinase/response regulator n=1 Tax=Rufibacter immobilis TaxID=1348778 RepID=UPI0035E588F3
MPQVKNTFSLHSIRGKIIAAVLLGALAVAMSWSITQKGFKDILQTVDQVSAPNEKLRTVNVLFQRLTQLDQLQRAHANRGSQQRHLFKKEIDSLQSTLDTLRHYSAGNAQQLQLLDSMETKLLKREKLFAEYLSLRGAMIHNEALSRRIASISRVLASSKPHVDSTVVTASKKITTTTILPSEESASAPAGKQKPSFFSRIFGGRKEENLPPALKQVEEELQVQIDTLSVARQDSALWKVEKMMRRVEQEHHQRSTQLLNREMKWITANSQLHNQLLLILRTFEEEELAAMHQNQQAAKGVVNGSIGRIDHIMVLFSLGTVLLVFLIFLDISRSNKYRKQLIAAKEEAEQLGQVKQRFLANMSHEIRTPLQTILGFSEQIRSQQRPSRKAIDAIYQSSEHLLHIVNEVLDYSRIVSGKFSFEQRPFAVKSLVTEVLEAMQLSADQKLLSLKLECALEGNPQYVGDPFRLRQMLYNLIGNAIKFTDAGGVTLRIFPEADAEAAGLVFEVSDTGVGIPAHKLETIFQSFEQADATVVRTRGGTGLGLSIVKALAEGQGGTVTVQSTEGRGSVFRISLPYGQVMQEERLNLNLPLAQNTSGLKTGKVLVVDDDAFILQLCGSIFQKNGVDFTCTSEAALLLRQEWDEAVQLVLLDIRMPEINGLELCQALRKTGKRNLQIFALTAEALPEERQYILDHGFDGLLMKPFREVELMALVNGKISVPMPQPETVALPGEVAFNLSPLRQMVGHDDEILKAVLQQFVSETEQDLDGLSASLTHHQAEEVRETLHKLAGRTAQLGAEELAANLRKMEIALRQQTPLAALQLEILVLREMVSNMKVQVQEQADALAEMVV